MSKWNRHSVDGFSGPDQLPSSANGIAAIISGRIRSYGVADGVISIVSPSRTLMLPDVPWFSPAAFISRHASMMPCRVTRRCPPPGLARRG
jgi:hypothetical protein